MATEHHDLTDTTTWTTYTRACSRYRVSLRTLQRLADKGVITRVRVPHRRPSVYLLIADLERVLTPLEIEPATAAE